MADVNVTVMIDGKPAFSAGAVGAVDGHQTVIGFLDSASQHFRGVVSARTPPLATPQRDAFGIGPALNAVTAQPTNAKQDNSL